MGSYLAPIPDLLGSLALLSGAQRLWRPLAHFGGALYPGFYYEMPVGTKALQQYLPIIIGAVCILFNHIQYLLFAKSSTNDYWEHLLIPRSQR